jgi:uncharacterized protein (DUF1697 family)
MPTFVALLRGVNVGNAKRLPMAGFRALLSPLGYTGVATLLNSGNAVFRATTGTSAQHGADMATAIKERFGLEVPVIVKSAAELAAIVSENPIEAEASQHSRILVAFMQDPNALSGLATIAPFVGPGERFVVGRHAAFLRCATGILDSKAGVALLGKTGASATTRNWATVLKLQALASDI